MGLFRKITGLFRRGGQEADEAEWEWGEEQAP